MVERPPIYVLRLRSFALEVFKCLHSVTLVYISDMFDVSATPYKLSGGAILSQPLVITTRKGLHSFRYQGTKIWNELPTSIKCVESMSIFKQRSNVWPGPNCKCGCCLLCTLHTIWSEGFTMSCFPSSYHDIYLYLLLKSTFMFIPVHPSSVYCLHLLPSPLPTVA